MNNSHQLLFKEINKSIYQELPLVLRFHNVIIGGIGIIICTAVIVLNPEGDNAIETILFFNYATLHYVLHNSTVSMIVSGRSIKKFQIFFNEMTGKICSDEFLFKYSSDLVSHVSATDQFFLITGYASMAFIVII